MKKYLFLFVACFGVQAQQVMPERIEYFNAERGVKNRIHPILYSHTRRIEVSSEADGALPYQHKRTAQLSKGKKQMKQIKAFLKQAEEIAQSQAKQWKNRSLFTTEIPSVFVLPYAEFQQKYDTNLYLNNDSDVLVFDGSLALSQGTLNRSWLNEQYRKAGGGKSQPGMFVNGSLRINGDIIDDYYLYLLVAKDVVCDYLHSEDGTIIIKGNLTALQGVSGEYNDGMLQVFGSTTAPYLVSNDHAMPDKSLSDYIYINDGKVGQRYLGALEGWSYFDHSELMFQPGIHSGNHAVSIQSFFERVKNNKNPLVNFAAFEQHLAQQPDDNNAEDDDVTEHEEHKEQTLEQLLYLPNKGRSDNDLYQFIISETERIQSANDGERFGQPFYDLLTVFAQMLEHRHIVAERYPPEWRRNINNAAICLADHWGRYLLNRPYDERQLQMAYDFCQELADVEDGQTFIYETIVRLGLLLRKFDETYVLVRVLVKYVSDFHAIDDIVASEGYQTWLAKLQ